LARAATGGARVVYVGDERSNSVEIELARNAHVDWDAPKPEKVIGFLVTGAASAGPGCEPNGTTEGQQICRVAHGVRLLAPRVVAGAGRDAVEIYVPRRGAVAYGGPGNDWVAGSYAADGQTLLPGEFHGGPG
jgi:hypothetical protein